MLALMEQTIISSNYWDGREFDPTDFNFQFKKWTVPEWASNAGVFIVEWSKSAKPPATWICIWNAVSRGEIWNSWLLGINISFDICLLGFWSVRRLQTHSFKAGRKAPLRVNFHFSKNRSPPLFYSFLFIDCPEDHHSNNEKEEDRKDAGLNTSRDGDQDSINQWSENGSKFPRNTEEGKKFSTIGIGSEDSLKGTRGSLTTPHH